MLRKLFVGFLLIVCLIACKSRTEIVLQEEESTITENPTEFIFPETTTGSICFDYYINPEFSGLFLFQNQDETVFEYFINTKRKLYPRNSETNKWQQISLKWNIENSSLKIFIGQELQTTRLIKSDKITSINRLTLKPDRRNIENSFTIRNVTYKGMETQVPERIKIVAFGNSTTAFRNTITGVYTQRLPDLLLNEGIPNIIYNQGVGGSHTGHLTDNNRHKVRHALDRLQSDVLSKKPDISIVCFGINDSWIDTGKDAPRIPLEEFEKNLNYIVKTIQKEGSSVILMTPNALGKRHEKWRYDNTEKYVEVIRNIAIQQKVVLIDQWKIWENYSSAGKDIDDLLLDGTHPNDKWHEELAELLADRIKTLSKSTKKL